MALFTQISFKRILSPTLFAFLCGAIYAQAPIPNIANEYIKLAAAYKRNAQPDSAIYFYDKAASEFKLYNLTEQEVDAYNQIGIILTRQDQYQQAMDYLNKALSFGQSALDSNSAVVATTHISLGVVYNAEEQYEKSLQHHNKALAIRQALYGENHADVATSYGNLGNVYLNNKQYDQSIEAHTKAMQIRETLFGLSSPEIVESYRGLGNVYRATKEYEKSLGYFEKALENKILQYGKDAKEVGRFYTYVSEAHYLLNQTQQGDLFKSKAAAVSLN